MELQNVFKMKKFTTKAQTKVKKIHLIAPKKCPQMRYNCQTLMKVLITQIKTLSGKYNKHHHADK